MTNDYSIKNESCWHCESKKVEKVFEPVDSVSFLKNAPLLICRSCGFIYKSPNISKDKNGGYEITYYDDYDKDALLERSYSRALVDVSRALNYIEFIKQHVNLNKVKKALDVGGAEGFFSNTLKRNVPGIDVYCLEPDGRAVEAGKQLYPSVKFMNGRLEDLDDFAIKEFDLITYWGGFYRTVEPRKAMRSLFNNTSDKANLFFSLPFKFDDARNQAEEPYESVDDILGNASMLMLDDAYMMSFAKEYFDIVKYEYRQNHPFFKKIPFLVVQKNENNKNHWEACIDSSKYRKNVEYICDYAFELSKQRFNNMRKENKLENIVIWGVNEEARILAEISKKCGVNVMFFISQYGDEGQIDGFEVNLLSEIYKNMPDALFIGDPVNEGMLFEQLCKRIHLDRQIPVVKCFSQKTKHIKSTFSYDSKNYLRKAFSFLIYEDK